MHRMFGIEQGLNDGLFVEHHSAGRPPCGAGPGPPPDPATRKRPPPPKEVAAPRPGIH